MLLMSWMNFEKIEESAEEKMRKILFLVIRKIWFCHFVQRIQFHLII